MKKVVVGNNDKDQDEESPKNGDEELRGVVGVEE